jgi:hypothetical protein
MFLGILIVGISSRPRRSVSTKERFDFSSLNFQSKFTAKPSAMLLLVVNVLVFCNAFVTVSVFGHSIGIQDTKTASSCRYEIVSFRLTMFSSNNVFV